MKSNSFSVVKKKKNNYACPLKKKSERERLCMLFSAISN